MGAPSWGPVEDRCIDGLIGLALKEDLGETGDLTCRAVIPEGMTGRAAFVVRQGGVVVGLPILSRVFGAVDSQVNVQVTAADGAAALPQQRIASVEGALASILTGERTALNFLQRLSGIATQTRKYVEQLEGTRCRLLDTRKTTPGWRVLEKYAVRCGGGHNHRMGLFDAVMIKDNHLAGLRHEGTPLAAAVRLARSKVGSNIIIEVEVDSLEQLMEALGAQPDVVLLDNMSVETLREAVQLRNNLAPTVRLEASGGITLGNLRQVALTGVDCVSVGALTHSAPALDIALDYEA
jgi:nicotinate-nucleotide pyrophosphorylase (carboxylating)